MIPKIETPRLVLRAHTLSDFPESAAMWADPIVTRFIGGKPSTKQQAWARFTSYLGHWQYLGYGFWAIEEKSTGRFIGELGFATFHREITPAIDVPEMGWALTSAAHGKGYASEALTAAVAWGDQHFTTDTACIIDPGNVPSEKVAAKLGFEQSVTATYLGDSVVLYRRKRR